MQLAVKQDVSADPPDIGFLRAATVMACVDGIAYAVEEPRRLGISRIGTNDRRTCHKESSGRGEA